MKRFRLSGAALGAALLAGCAGVGGPREAPPAAEAPAQWQAPLPHNGQAADLKRWWEQFDDPLLAQLVAAAQDVSPTLASAASRIEQARAARVAAGAALLPQVDGTASIVRGRQDFVSPLGSQAAAGVQAGWELDLFGARRSARDAARARLTSAEAGWHEARVSVAAEVASAYLGLRACEAQLVTTETDARSRGETARLTELSARAGFQAPATEALSRASAAQARAQLAAQRAQCDVAVKALVALTGQAEPALRERLGARSSTLPQPAQIAVGAVPAEVLNQRPDLYSAAHDLVAASADVSTARAQRLPRITLSGSIQAARFEAGGVSSDGTLWQVGPLAVSLPLFDGGTRRANVDAAKARYDEAVAVYRARLRGAVREVEEALVQLQSTASRAEDVRIAVEGYEASYRATEARFRGGLASLFELEDARRTSAAAQSQYIDLQRERVAAWISLYRALGGGWTVSDTSNRQAAATSGGRAMQ
ncbi:efflux transporter outer membrane subunit [Piscinibacter sp. XHJ-5]|uniref:efflux transporter outer membrane subunit n=1 Tax=Piscinibacter sp. XHJ-5 TaxID=3037797 RepID=UPI002452CBC8|nr:efflux transporter outer membrane subunit [Piscinibacter sp. XHJ-5]